MAGPARAALPQVLTSRERAIPPPAMVDLAVTESWLRKARGRWWVAINWFFRVGSDPERGRYMSLLTGGEPPVIKPQSDSLMPYRLWET